ncbi:MAG TPA: hypothetical protein VGI89_12735, partial [Rhizomicrobium sp.]
MKILAATAMLSVGILPAVSTIAMAAEPDDLKLPPGFHATIVAEGLGEAARHMAFRDASHLYVSTERQSKDAPNVGIIALHLNAKHVADKTEHFSSIDNGTGITIYKGALYTTSADTLYRFKLKGDELVPSAAPEAIVSGVPGRAAIAFDDKNNLFIAVGGGNVCAPEGTPRTQKSVGPRPCPILDTRAGVWRFDASKTGQTWSGGEHYAIGIRDTNALAFSHGALYTVLYGRDAAEKAYPEIITPEAGAHISDEMFKVEKGTDMGWPYTHYDSALKIRLEAPEYGGDGKMVVSDAKYAVPVAAFPAHVAPMDVAFYNAKQCPMEFRGGAFIAFHGAGGGDPGGHDDGYNVMFVPFGKDGTAQMPMVFADGFAGPTRDDKNGKRARYRPV